MKSVLNNFSVLVRDLDKINRCKNSDNKYQIKTTQNNPMTQRRRKVIKQLNKPVKNNSKET